MSNIFKDEVIIEEKPPKPEKFIGAESITMMEAIQIILQDLDGEFTSREFARLIANRFPFLKDKASQVSAYLPFLVKRGELEIVGTKRSDTGHKIKVYRKRGTRSVTVQVNDFKKVLELVLAVTSGDWKKVKRIDPLLGIIHELGYTIVIKKAE